MALNWEQIQDTSDTDPPISVIYGGGGLGKTSLLGEFPNPLYVRTAEGEHPPTGVVMKSWGVCDTLEDVYLNVDYMLSGDHPHKTFGLDSIDGLEILINKETCRRNEWKNLEDPGYGKGFAEADVVCHEFMTRMHELKKAGYFVTIIGHAKVKTDPGVTTDSYPRYRLNLRDTMGSIITDNSDLVGFIHQRVSIKKEDAGFKKTNTRGEGSGERMIAVEERPGFVAKNRYEMPPTIAFKRGAGFTELAKYFPQTAGFEAI